MLTLKTNIQKERLHQLATCLGAWALMFGTFIGMADVAREPAVVLATDDPAAHSNFDANELLRKESENETVHMPTKYDVGLRMNAISGRK